MGVSKAFQGVSEGLFLWSFTGSMMNLTELPGWAYRLFSQFHGGLKRSLKVFKKVPKGFMELKGSQVCSNGILRNF